MVDEKEKVIYESLTFEYSAIYVRNSELYESRKPLVFIILYIISTYSGVSTQTIENRGTDWLLKIREKLNFNTLSLITFLL